MICKYLALMKKIVAIFLLSFFLSANAYAMTQNQMMIISQVLNAEGGKITKQMHTDFWKDIPSKEDFVEYLETTGLMAKITRYEIRADFHSSI